MLSTCLRPGFRPGLQLARIMECGLSRLQIYHCVQLNALFRCCREMGYSPWFNKAARATLESCIIACVNLDVMVRWPSLLCRRHALYMVLKSTLESRDCRWTSSRADRLSYRQNVSRLWTRIDVLRRTFHCDRRDKTRWRTLSTLMFRLCARRCEYFVYIAVNKSSCK